jgi:hypothetical protein
MTFTKRWPGHTGSKLTEFTDELAAPQRARRRTARKGARGGDGKGLLGSLAVSQSVTVRWGEGRPKLEVEESFRCSSCGEVLTELRLVSMCPAVSVCPICGRPPSA